MKYFYLFCCLLSCFGSYSQAGIFLDEDELKVLSGTAIEPDPTAFEEKALVRYKGSSGSSNETFFYGPYTSWKAGDYLVQYRMKVSENTSTSQLCILDVFSNVAGKVFGSLPITPSMFKNANEWQVFTFPIHIPTDVPDIEIRGMTFVSGLSNLYLDYVNITSPNVLSIGGSGNVGIGTNDTKGYKLGVNGNAIFNKVVVKQWPNWSDYVFEANYPLRPLKEVEQYIRQNGHLPEIPSAAQVEKNGLDVGDNQAALLKKIEELTLYIIDQNKRLEAFEKELKQLKQAGVKVTTGKQ